MAFQELENEYICLFSMLVDPTNGEKGLMIASQLPFRKILTLVGALIQCRTSDEGILKLLKQVSTESLQLEDKRNRYIHSFYDWRSIAEGGITYERIKNKIGKGYKFNPDYEMFDPEAVDKIADDIRGEIGVLGHLIERLESTQIIPDRFSEEE